MFLDLVDGASVAPTAKVKLYMASPVQGSILVPVRQPIYYELHGVKIHLFYVLEYVSPVEF